MISCLHVSFIDYYFYLKLFLRLTLLFFFFFLSIRRPPSSTLFPYPPLFRSPRLELPGARLVPPGAVPAAAAARVRALAHVHRVRRRRRYATARRRRAVRKMAARDDALMRSEEHTSELQSQSNLVCRLLLEKK